MGGIHIALFFLFFIIVLVCFTRKLLSRISILDLLFLRAIFYACFIGSPVLAAKQVRHPHIFIFFNTSFM